MLVAVICAEPESVCTSKEASYGNVVIVVGICLIVSVDIS
jgi:hypothetical protein